jgi:hypothetical protein
MIPSSSISSQAKARGLSCGGRSFDREAELILALDAEHYKHPFTLLIHGMAGGADQMAERWAKSRGIPTIGFPARWEKYGMAAGSIRNTKMLREGLPSLVLAFPGGRGTENMIKQAQAEPMPVKLMLGMSLKTIVGRPSRYQ